VSILHPQAPAGPSVHIEFHPQRAPDFTALIGLCGEHDLVTVPQLEDAFASVYGSILVDLSACEFVDSSVLRTILAKHERLERDGQRLELLVPEHRRNIARVLAISEVDQVLRVHVTLPPGVPETSS
jgi:anti-anti-sigma factor